MEFILLDCSARFYGLTAMSFWLVVYALAKENKVKSRPYDEDHIAGKEWFMGIMRSHQKLSIRHIDQQGLLLQSVYGWIIFHQP